MKLPIALGLSAFAATSLISIPASAAPRQAGNCHAAYIDCVPADHDVDCGADKLPPIRLRQVGVDPYRLDRNANGVGCEVDEGAPPVVPPSTEAPAPVPPTTKAAPPTTKPGAVKATPKFTG